MSVAVTVGLRKTELWSTRFVYYVHINITLNTTLQSLLLTQDSETPYAWLRPVSLYETLLDVHHLFTFITSSANLSTRVN